MTAANIKLVDNDYVVRAETEMSVKEHANTFRNFFKQMNEELVPGETAYLEFEGFESNPVSFEITKSS